MKAYAEFNDYEIVGEYEDAGKSGKSIEGRTEFNRMMEDIKCSGAVSKWLKQAMRGSAFFRNIFGQAKTECRKNGTQGIIFIRNSKWNEL